MKLSAYYKQQNCTVELKQNYDDLRYYDKVFISKVFSSTIVPENILAMHHVEYGGTGFDYEKTSALPDEIEHIKPDYHLYDEWVNKQINLGEPPKSFAYYTDYSIGFLTRGCFRRCPYCINRNSSHSKNHSQLHEFLDESRPKICFLDDNFLACENWKRIIEEVKMTRKRFEFKQGLDVRLLNVEIINEIFSWKYDDYYFFAFDDIADSEIIENALIEIHRTKTKKTKRLKFYVLCAYDRQGKWDSEFWINDIRNTFERCIVLAKYGALPYIMRYEKYRESPYKQIYIALASWVNQPYIFKKIPFRTFCMMRGMSNENRKIYGSNYKKYLLDGNIKYSIWQAMESLAKEYPEFAERYYDIVMDDIDLSKQAA